MTKRTADADTILCALRVLSRLVEDEYPVGRSLPEIAEVWGNATPEEIDAVREAVTLLADYRNA